MTRPFSGPAHSDRPLSRVHGAHLIVLGAVLLGAALRWHHLGWENLWMDEAYSVDLARGSVGRIMEERWTDIHPPLYYLALHYWILIAGYSEAGVRLLSTLFSLSAIVATYAVAIGLIGPAAAAIAAVLVAASAFHVEWGQEARMYALLGLASTLSMHAFVALTSRRRPATFIAYVAVTTVLVYTHVYSMFILAAQASTLALWWSTDRVASRRAIAAWCAAVAGVALLYTPWLAVLVNQASRVRSAFWIPRPGWQDGIAVFKTYAGSERLAWLIGALAIAGSASLLLRRRAVRPRPSPLMIMVPWLVAPILLPLLASWIGTPVFLPKYAIAASIPFAMFAAYGLMQIPHIALRAPVVVALAALTITSFTSYYGSRRREGWRHAVATVEALAERNDLVLFYPGFNQYPYDYYRQRDDLIERAFPLEPMAPVPEPAPLADMIAAATGDTRRVWLVALQGAKERVPIAAGLARDRTQVEHIVSQWIEVDLFARTR